MKNRPSRISIPEDLQATCRVNASVIFMGEIEVLFICVYGFAKKCLEGRRLNDILLARVFNIANECNMPFVVGGDFNTPPTSLPSFQAFAGMGAIEIFTYHKCITGIELPKTCKNATSNDTMIIHPRLIPFISKMEVRQDLQIDVHSPMIVTFNLEQTVEPRMIWDVPNSWHSLVESPQLFEQSYEICRDKVHLNSAIQDPEKDGEVLLQEWSRVVENAVDRTIQIQHLNQPERFPTRGLPLSHKGRCVKRERELVKHSGGPRADRQTGYEPPEEVFRLHSKQKVKQVRRIRSYIRATNSANEKYGKGLWPHDVKLQLQQEWNKIMNAVGYPGTWWKWILAFECVTHVTWDNPSDEFVSIVAQITEHDCNITCCEEANIRDRFRKQRIQIDSSAGSGKLVYKILKGKQTKPLQQFPVFVEVQATLCRSSRQSIVLRIADDAQFMVGQLATFGDADVRIEQQQKSVVKIQLLKGILPTVGLLKQSSYAYSTSDVFREFQRFWAPIWLRENQHEQFDQGAWEDFFQQLEDIVLPKFDLKVTLDDPELWISTIQRMKSYTAHGACGWRTEELKVLPKQAIYDLCEIFKKIWPSGMPANLAQARVIMLEKNAAPKGIQDGRPITILSVVSRLASKLIADQVLLQLSTLLPPQISGGLVARGTYDLSVQQHFQIEKAISNRTQLGGDTLDLVKAFNYIPRCPLRQLFCLFGVPDIPANFWFVGLSNLKRFPQVQGCLGEPLSSTCGVPEGDAMSVLSMVLLSATYYYKICTPRVQPYAYADNWSFMTMSEREQFKTLKSILNFVASLKMKIDHSKSWAWGTSKQFRDSCQDLELLFPDGLTPIVVKTSTKDLGYHIHYDKRITLDEMKERLQSGIQRCEKLHWIPIDVITKAKFIQQSVWPAALHAAGSQVLGKRHFRDLRRAATKALLCDHKHASSFLACSCLVSGLDDPLLYVVIQIVRSIRRLFAYFPELAQQMVNFSVGFGGSVAFGPASALKKYLEKIKWKLHQDGSLTGPAGFTAHLFLNSPKELKKILRQAWGCVVFDEVKHRKGISEHFINHRLTCKVFKSFPSSEQVILAMNVTGGVQSGTIKSFWAEDKDGTCGFCGAPDTHTHRLLECSATKCIRDKHLEAVRNLTEERPEWVWLPLARAHDECEFLRFVFHTRTLPEVHSLENFADNLDDVPKLRFYTDGACSDPTDEEARRASWGIIWDTSSHDSLGVGFPNRISNVDVKLPDLTCVATGLVGGVQTPARAELSAILHATKISCSYNPPKPTEIYTDASYVMNVVKNIPSIQQGNPVFKIPNLDLVLQLTKLWDPNVHCCFKVKAHRNVTDASDYQDAWHIVANHMADRAANTSLSGDDQTIIDTSRNVAEHNKEEYCKLRMHYLYIIELAKYRMKLINDQKSAGEVKLHFLAGENPPENEVNQQQQIVDIDEAFQQVCNKLAIWNNASYQSMTFPEISPHVLNACSSGKNIASLFWNWLNLLQWPEEVCANVPDPQYEWGVSYFELVVNFALCTGDFLPLPLHPNQRYVEYVPYSSDSGILLPTGKRAASVQVFAFEKLLRRMEALSQRCLIPKFPKAPRWNCRSLTLLGYKGQVAGVSIRPNMPYAQETSEFVHKYIRSLRKGAALDKPLIRPDVPVILPFPNLHEDPPKQRANAAACIRVRLAKERAQNT